MVKTASGAIAVQIVYSSRRGSRSIEHLGSSHDKGELEALKAAARQRLTAGQGELDLGLPAGPLRGIDERVAKAEKAVAGKTPVKRNRFVRLSGGIRSVNRALEAKARALAHVR
jgi:hypothetical protein